MSELIPEVAAGEAADLKRGGEVSEEGSGKEAGRWEGLLSPDSGALVCGEFKVTPLWDSNSVSSRSLPVVHGHLYDK